MYRALILIILYLISYRGSLVNASENALRIFFPVFEFNSDPQTMLDARSMQINLQVHRGLFRYLPNGEIKPDLAASWKFSDNHLELRVKLRKSTFSNGTPIEPIHVVNSFARLFLVESSMSADLQSISGVDLLKAKKTLSHFGVKAS